MQELQNKNAFICDMDGVIYHGNRLLPGVSEFLGVLNLDLAARRSRAMTLLRSVVKSRFDTP